MAEVVGALRRGKPARLSPGEVACQLGDRPPREQLADFQSYCQVRAGLLGWGVCGSATGHSSKPPPP